MQMGLIDMHIYILLINAHQKMLFIGLKKKKKH